MPSPESVIASKRGDNQRGKNQEAVLTAILQKAMSPAILKNANEILASVSDCVETNMTREEMAKFINMQLTDGASWNISSEAATGIWRFSGMLFLWFAEAVCDASK